jgi:uncharacterized membrane protein
MMWSGVALIAVGVILICVQIWLQVAVPAFQAPSRSLGVEGLGTKASVQTTYVGLVLVVLGAFLEIIGYLGARPRSESPGHNE